MTKPSGHASQYRIVVRSECGPLLDSLIDGIQVGSCQAGSMCAVAPVRDESEFWGLMGQIQDLGLHVISLHELDGDDGLPSSTSALSQPQVSKIQARPEARPPQSPAG